MPTWLRSCPMHTLLGVSHRETWVSKDSPDDEGRRYEVNVRLGKPIDVLSLKLNVLEDFGSQVAQVRSTRTALFASEDTEAADQCPVCGSSIPDGQPCLTIYGASYHQCGACTHYFLVKRPTKAALEAFYSSDRQYARTYTDRRMTETRVREVAAPKAEWTIEQFRCLFGREPRSVLDVGAGGGHFVHACRQLGLECEGIELGEASREFCREQFGFDLHAVDFAEAWEGFSGVDVVTFWGVIEHVPDPLSLLKAAHQVLAETESLVVAEVPRWDCLSTAIQACFPDSVVRHLDPLGHVHCFTDASLATAFEAAGFGPAAAWYFGMDAYELTTQLSHRLQDSRILDILGEHIPSLQDALDRARMSDEIALAGAPLATGSAL